MKLDRNLQRQILEALRDCYPERHDALFDSLDDCDNHEAFLANLYYLGEHGLILSGNITTFGPLYIEPKITARGLDFLADDGGLTTILGVVTVKLHDDTLRQLIAAKVEQADLPAPEKKRLLDQIRELQPKALEHLTMKLLDQGLESSGKVLAMIAGAIA